MANQFKKNCIYCRLAIEWQILEIEFVCVFVCVCVCARIWTSGGLSFQGKNINEDAARVLQEGLDECARWRDLDIQAHLMVEGAELEAQRGKTDDSMAMLQVTTDTQTWFLSLFITQSLHTVYFTKV